MVDKQQLAAMGEHMQEMEECNPEFKVPEGWQLVPVTVTPEMFNASMKWDFWPIRPSNFQRLYDSMLAAAPEYKP